MEERKSLNAIVTPLDNALKESDDLNAAIELADDDESIAAEVPDRVARLETIVERARADLGDALTNRQGSARRAPGRVAE